MYIPAAEDAAAGEDGLVLLEMGAEQLMVWLILNSTHLLLDILLASSPDSTSEHFAVRTIH